MLTCRTAFVEIRPICPIERTYSACYLTQTNAIQLSPIVRVFLIQRRAFQILNIFNAVSQGVQRGTDTVISFTVVSVNKSQILLEQVQKCWNNYLPFLHSRLRNNSTLSETNASSVTFAKSTHCWITHHQYVEVSSKDGKWPNLSRQ